MAQKRIAPPGRRAPKVSLQYRYAERRAQRPFLLCGKIRRFDPRVHKPCQRRARITRRAKGSAPLLHLAFNFRGVFLREIAIQPRLNQSHHGRQRRLLRIMRLQPYLSHRQIGGPIRHFSRKQEPAESHQRSRPQKQRRQSHTLQHTSAGNGWLLTPSGGGHTAGNGGIISPAHTRPFEGVGNIAAPIGGPFQEPLPQSFQTRRWKNICNLWLTIRNKMG